MDSKFGFRVGDRVVYIREPNSEFFAHIEEFEPGTICCLDGYGNDRVGVQFDKYHYDFHSCGGKGKNNHCLYVLHYELGHMESVSDLPDFLAADQLDVNAFLGVV